MSAKDCHLTRTIQNNMKHLIIFTLILFLLSGCGVQTWTEQDLTAWYTGNKSKYPHFYSPLYYRGTDKHYHYFICRTFDIYANMRVKREEIEIDEVRPPIGVFGKPFPGYYPVDPNDNYNRVD
jgi:hypothetical protein